MRKLGALPFVLVCACSSLASTPTTSAPAPCPTSIAQPDATCEAVAPAVYEFTFSDGRKAWCRDAGDKAWCSVPVKPMGAESPHASIFVCPPSIENLTAPAEFRGRYGAPLTLAERL